MNQGEFCKYLAQKTGFTVQVSTYIVQIVLSTLEDAVCDYGSVKLRGFGRFTGFIRKGYARRNRFTKKPEMINPTPYVRFVPGKSFKDKLHNIQIKIKNGRIVG